MEDTVNRQNGRDKLILDIRAYVRELPSVTIFRADNI